MYEYYFTFRSMTRAQQAAVELHKLGVSALLLRAPKQISSMGCGYAVRVMQADAHRTAGILRAMGVAYEKSIRMTSDGMVKEVYL